MKYKFKPGDVVEWVKNDINHLDVFTIGKTYTVKSGMYEPCIIDDKGIKRRVSYWDGTGCFVLYNDLKQFFYKGAV